MSFDKIVRLSLFAAVMVLTTGCLRTGSHSLILGLGNNYTGYANIVQGYLDNANSSMTAITGSFNSSANFPYTSVLAGSGVSTPSASYSWCTVGTCYH